MFSVLTVVQEWTVKQVMNRIDDINEIMGRINQKLRNTIDEMETEQAKRERCKKPKCYFCGGDCYSNTTVTINCGNLDQSELFKAYVCNDCLEAVHSALILLRLITKGR